MAPEITLGDTTSPLPLPLPPWTKRTPNEIRNRNLDRGRLHRLNNSSEISAAVRFALEHKVVLNDVTDTETEDQSFKDNDDNMLRDDMLLSEHEELEKEIAMNHDSCRSSRSSSEEEDTPKKDNAGPISQKMVKDGVLDSSFALEEIPMRNLRMEIQMRIRIRVTIKTAKMGRPNVPIMIKDSKDGSVHGGAKIKVGELPKLLDRTGSYTKVLSPRRASMSDMRNGFSSLEKMSSGASSPTTADTEKNERELRCCRRPQVHIRIADDGSTFKISFIDKHDPRNHPRLVAELSMKAVVR